MTDEPEYYTDDITRLPYGVLWRCTIRASVVFGPIVFLLFALRKLLGWRFAASHGVARLESLPRVPAIDIPRGVRETMAEPIHELREAGFTVAFCLEGTYIGSKRSFAAVLLHETGRVIATVTWLRLTVGTTTTRRLILGLQSKRPDGTEIVTGPLADSDWVPEIIPPYVEFEKLDADTPPRKVLRIHLDRIARETDLRTFDEETLGVEMLDEGRRLFDFLVAKGYYARQSDADVRRLTRTTR
jgi:hypothetical protein